MLSDLAIAELERLTAPPPGARLYGIVDGASVPDFLGLAKTSPGPYSCLYAGPLDPEVERVAPYLVELSFGSELTRCWWREGWGSHWGILAHLPVDWSLSDVRRHFRTFLRVQLPDKRYVLFRYYDPRVLRQYLPTCTEEEASTIFGPVTTFFAEDEDPSVMLRFTPGMDGVIPHRVELLK